MGHFAQDLQALEAVEEHQRVRLTIADLLNPSLNSLPVKLNKRVDLLSLLGKDVRKTHSINKIMK